MQRTSYDALIILSIMIYVMTRQNIPTSFKACFFFIWVILFHRTMLILSSLTRWRLQVAMGGNRDKISKLFANEMITNQMRISHNFEKIPTGNTLYVCNYPRCELEYLAIRILPGLVCGISALPGYKMKLAASRENRILIPVLGAASTYEMLKSSIREKIKTRSVFGYIENSNSHDIEDETLRLPLRTGLVSIAHSLNLTITPVFISSIKVKFGRVISDKFVLEVGETTNVTNVKQTMRDVRDFLTSRKEKYKNC